MLGRWMRIVTMPNRQLQNIQRQIATLCEFPSFFSGRNQESGSLT
jgi:hypothetical protein